VTYYDSKAQGMSPDETITQTITESTATRNNTRTGDNYTKNKKVKEVRYRKEIVLFSKLWKILTNSHNIKQLKM
jgi:hypothetical protein